MDATTKEIIALVRDIKSQEKREQALRFLMACVKGTEEQRNKLLDSAIKQPYFSVILPLIEEIEKTV